MSEFYSLPFSFEDLLYQRSEALKCSLEKSIRQHIAMILVTRLGSYRYNPDYGCSVWEEDFVTPSSPEKWKNDIKDKLAAAIEEHEERIEEITRFVATIQKNHLRQAIEIELEGTLKETNEKFSYTDTLYFSPYTIL